MDFTQSLSYIYLASRQSQSFVVGWSRPSHAFRTPGGRKRAKTAICNKKFGRSGILANERSLAEEVAPSFGFYDFHRILEQGLEPLEGKEHFQRLLHYL